MLVKKLIVLLLNFYFFLKTITNNNNRNNIKNSSLDNVVYELKIALSININLSIGKKSLKKLIESEYCI